MLSFVLARRDTREVDQIITLYTAERGKIDVLARGIKKSVAKNATAIEGPALLEVETANGKEFPVMTTATIVEPFFNLRKSYEGLAAISLVLKVVHELTPKHEPDQKLFTTLYKIFKWFAESDGVGRVQVDRSVLEILSATGFRPEVERCVICAAKINDTQKHVFSVARGGVVCDEHMNETGYTITPGVRALFMPNVSEKSVTISESEARMFHVFVYEFLVFYTNKHLVDWGG